MSALPISGRLRPAVAALVLLAVLAACGDSGGRGSDGPHSEAGDGGGVSNFIPAAVRTANAQTPPTSAFESAAHAVLPSVVYILVEARPRQLFMPLGQLRQGSPNGRAPLRPYGSGSGVIFQKGGYILTNNHVVQEAARVRVTLYDHREFDAQVVARDPSTDIAVVKIEGQNLPVAKLGNSDSLHVGQWVEALGNPLGVALQFTVTAGIIGATGRSIGILAENGASRAGEAAPLEDYLQTDAAINPGNSGGPLVDLAGEVIGINSAIASTTGAFTGYGFAIPINLARHVAEELITYGEVRRPYLGVILGDVSPVDAKVFSLPSVSGAEVLHVESGSPADHAGMQLGDVIVKIGDQDVHTVSGLQAVLAALQPGSTAQVQLIRYGKRVTLSVKMGQVTSGVKPKPAPSVQNEPSRAGFGVEERGGHVVIAAVRDYSPAQRAGVAPGQVILQANRQAISSIDQLVAVIRKANGGPLSLIVDDPQVGKRIINYQLSP
ncbi:MAG TPA: trypsin-like peptidase domain-containing protein [Gemmatimonadaceae bacterium]|nr:trypsin-like peptidase domain-containing protein [Gemmatimonadaceae bacterium]